VIALLISEMLASDEAAIASDAHSGAAAMPG
jgi:hypothetical protein